MLHESRTCFSWQTHCSDWNKISQINLLQGKARYLLEMATLVNYHFIKVFCKRATSEKARFCSKQPLWLMIISNSVLQECYLSKLTFFEWFLEWSSYTGLTELIILYIDIFILFNQKKSITDKQEPSFCCDWFHRCNHSPVNHPRWSFLWR